MTDFRWCENIDSIALIVNKDFFIKYANIYAKKILDVEHLMGLSLLEFVDASKLRRLERTNCFTMLKTNQGEERFFLYITPSADDWLVLLQRPKMIIDKKIEQYVVTKQLGEGGTSTVFKCLDKISNETFAIKIITKDKLDLKSLNRISTEIKILKDLEHPNIIGLKDHWETSDTIYMVMELGHRELFDEITKSPLTYLGEKTARNYFKQILAGVKYLHARNIVHRDLKSENIVIVAGTVKIIDFGLAKNMATGIYRAKRNSICGTLDYMAPEVVARTGDYDKAVDVWSMGIILYTMLFGRYPFMGTTVTEISRNIRKGKIDKSFEEYSYVSPSARDLLEKMIHVDVASRVTIPEIERHPWYKKI